MKQKFALYVPKKNYCNINTLTIIIEIKNSVLSIEFFSMREFADLFRSDIIVFNNEWKKLGKIIYHIILSNPPSCTRPF